MSNRTGLGNLLKAFQGAILAAQELMQKQHIKQVKQYVDEDGKAKTIKVQVPNIGGKDENDKWRDVDVPLLTLSPPSTLKIKKMNVKFKARINGMVEPDKPKAKHCDDHKDHEDDCGCHDVQLHMGGFFSRSTEADIEIEFEAGETPEGFLKINDELVKAIH